MEQENKQKSKCTKKLKITHSRKMQVCFVTVLIVYNGISCFIPKFQRKFEEGKRGEKVYSGYYIGLIPDD